MGTVLKNQKGHVFVGWWSLRENEGEAAAGLLSPEVTVRTPDPLSTLLTLGDRSPVFVVFSLTQSNCSSVLGSHYIKFREIYSCLIVDDHIKMRVYSRENVQPGLLQSQDEGHGRHPRPFQMELPCLASQLQRSQHAEVFLSYKERKETISPVLLFLRTTFETIGFPTLDDISALSWGSSGSPPTGPHPSLGSSLTS